MTALFLTKNVKDEISDADDDNDTNDNNSDKRFASDYAVSNISNGDKKIIITSIIAIIGIKTVTITVIMVAVNRNANNIIVSNENS